jgi:hypothetical protein
MTIKDFEKHIFNLVNQKEIMKLKINLLQEIFSSGDPLQNYLHMIGQLKRELSIIETKMETMIDNAHNIVPFPLLIDDDYRPKLVCYWAF